VSGLSRDRLEEGVDKDAVGLRRTQQVGDAGVESFRRRQCGRDSGFPDARYHRGERIPGKTLDEFGPSRIDIDHARGNPNACEARRAQQGINASADARVAARSFL
jgi:hypothetical protein